MSIFTTIYSKTSQPGFLLLTILFVSLTTAAFEQHGYEFSRNDPNYDVNEDHDAHDQTKHGKGVVSVSSEILREFGINLAIATAATLHEEVILPGEIQFNQEQLAYITPRYNGTVTAIHVRLADKVRVGQVLATLESTETLRPFELKAPLDGTIVDYKITLGETVEAASSLFTLADLSSVWADLRIYQRDMDKVREGQRVVIKDRSDKPGFTGVINYITPMIDEHTRTGLARVVVDNRKGNWRPGQFIKGNIAIDEHEVRIAIPRSAVLADEGQTIVFVQTEEGFEPRPVVLGHSDAESFEVVDGLAPGEIYVAQNAISLKAEINKSSFGGHASHVH
jgi:membrane fusion protein, heavy metal efflux system